MNEMIFGMDGLDMTGNWYNPKTGDSFTVMDFFFEDNNPLIKTTDGRIIRYEKMMDYVKSDKPIEMPKPVENKPIETPKFVESIKEEPKPILGNLHKANTLDDYFIINKALSKYPTPKITVNVDWGKDFPKSQIESLMEMMDVKMEDIIAWYINNVTSEQIAEDISNGIEASINDQLGVKIEDKNPEVPKTKAKSKKK